MDKEIKMLWRRVLFILLFISANIKVNAFTLGDKIAVHGFWENSYGYRFKNDTTKKDEYNFLESRLQLKTRYYPESFLANWDTEIFFRGDFVIDGYFGGKTDFQLREFYIRATPFSDIDIKLGRQIFTWGTGEYLFINDLFPKDYVSFFIGRDDNYLKVPSDGVRISYYSRIANIDLAVIPFFEPNTIPSGERLSFLDTFEQAIVGRQSKRILVEPPRQFNNTEYGLRIYQLIKNYELALYFFHGFYKMPKGYLDENNHELFYPRLDVYGASIRGPFLGGIVNLEGGYYDSRNDRKGNNRLVENSSFKIMAGYEKDMGNDLRVGIQYFYEQILDYDEYINALLPQDLFWDKHRHLLTLKLNKLLWNQTLDIRFFVFYSPSDEDVYLRPFVQYDFSDDLTFGLGVNLMWGRDDITEFGQLERNSNLYFRIRYNF